jgi:hypothetical protein
MSNRAETERLVDVFHGCLFMGRKLRWEWDLLYLDLHLLTSVLWFFSFLYNHICRLSVSDGSYKPADVIDNLQDQGVQIHISFCSFFPSHEVVANLALKPTESFLRQHLEQYGEIVDVTVKDYQQYRETNMQEGYGFVTFRMYKDAMEASRRCQDVVVEGITLCCSITHRNRKQNSQSFRASPTTPSHSVVEPNPNHPPAAPMAAPQSGRTTGFNGVASQSPSEIPRQMVNGSVPSWGEMSYSPPPPITATYRMPPTQQIPDYPQPPYYLHHSPSSPSNHSPYLHPYQLSLSGTYPPPPAPPNIQPSAISPYSPPFSPLPQHYMMVPPYTTTYPPSQQPLVYAPPLPSPTMNTNQTNSNGPQINNNANSIRPQRRHPTHYYQ